MLFSMGQTSKHLVIKFSRHIDFQTKRKNSLSLVDVTLMKWK